MTNIKSKSCLRCASFMVCTDVRRIKVPNHSCLNFIRINNEVESMLDLPQMDLVPQSEPEEAPQILAADGTPARKKKRAMVVSEGDDDSDENPNFVLDAMRRAYDPKLHIVRDLKLDDTHFRHAKNFYDFCANVFGKNMRMPFARQLWIMLYLCGEVCPHCTKKRAKSLFNVPVDLDPHRLVKSMTLFEHGVCPKCGRTKWDYIQEGQMNDYFDLVLVAGQRCLVGDTRVQTVEGTYTFKELDGLHAEAYAGAEGLTPYLGPDLLDHDGTPVKPSHFFRSGITDVLKITLSDNREIQGTPDHPIWTTEGWVCLKDLSVGQEVPVRLGVAAWPSEEANIEGFYPDTSNYSAYWLDRIPTSTPKTLTEEHAGLIGYFLSEGCADGSGSRYAISNFDKNVRTYCKDVVKTLGGEAVDSRESVARGKKVRGVRIANRWLAGLMDNLTEGQVTRARYSADRFVPSCIFRSPKPVVVEFLRCLFEGDGSASHARGHRNSVGYGSISERLVRDVHSLLVSLGIPCSIRSRYRMATNGSPSQVPVLAWSVRVNGIEAVSRFHRIVGFKSSRKTARSRNVSRKLQDRSMQSTARHESLSSAKTLEYVYLHRRFETLSGCKVRRIPGGTRVRPSVIGKMTRHTAGTNLRAMIQHPETPADLVKPIEGLLRTVEDKSLYWLHVTKIEKVNKAPTYDVHVPGKHRFMVDGVLNHNTGKTTISAMLFGYMLHRYMLSPKISTVARGIQAFTPLTMSCVALTITKALQLLWKPIRSVLLESEWFEEYFAWLKVQGSRYGKEFYQFPEAGTYMRLFHKNLEAYPEGPSKRTLRGATRAACIAGGSLVDTSNGLRPIEDVRPGVDRVRFGNVWTDVTAATYSGVKPTVRIHTARGNELRCTGDHKILRLSISKQKPVWTRADALRQGDYLLRSSSSIIEDTCTVPSFEDFDPPDTKDWGMFRRFSWVASRKGLWTPADLYAELGITNNNWRALKDLRLSGLVRRHKKQGPLVPHMWETLDPEGVLSAASDRLDGPLTKRRLGMTLPSQLTPELARLIGYLIADGNYALWGSTTEISFFTLSLPRMADYIRCAKSVFGSAVNVSYSGCTARFSIQTARSFLAYLGLAPANAPKKRLPWVIHQAPLKLVAECLSAMISCDGAVTTSKVRYSTSSKTLADEVALLFQRFGYAPTQRHVLSRVTEEDCYLRGHKTQKCFRRKGTVTMNHVTRIHNVDAQDFYENWFTGTHKRDRTLSRKPRNYRTLNRREDNGQYFQYTSPYKCAGRRVFLQSHLNKSEVALPSIVDRGYSLTQVVSVEKEAPTKTYDITVAHKNHAFTVQGLIVHNSVTDELGHFPFDPNASDDSELDDERERANADEVVQVLTNSLATVRSEVLDLYKRNIFVYPQGFNLSISSPASFKDKIMRMYAESQGSTTMLGVKAATWEISPLYTRDHPVIRAMYEKNPRKADRDFGANPPSLSSSVFHAAAIRDQFVLKNEAAALYVDHKDSTRAKAVVMRQAAERQPATMSLDAGATNNAFAITITFKKPDGHIEAPVVLEVVAGKGKPIDFAHMYAEVIKPLIPAFNVKAVFADRWNSKSILDQIRLDFQDRVAVQQYSLKSSDFDAFIDIMNQGKLWLPTVELPFDVVEATIDFKADLLKYPGSHLYLQFLTVQLYQGMLVKGSAYTDDMFRSLVLGVTRHLDPKVSKYMSQFKAVSRDPMQVDQIVLTSGRSFSDPMSNGGVWAPRSTITETSEVTDRTVIYGGRLF